MKRALLRLFLLVCTMLALFFSIRFLREFTGGFRPGKVMLEGLCVEAPQEMPEEVKKIFQQSFRYLDQGCQSYVFESQDGHYVLKVIRTKRFSPPFWLDFVPARESFEKKFEEARRRNFARALESYQIAFSALKEETKLLYVHLQKSRDLPSIRLDNALCQSTFLDLNEVAFLIQKKAVPMKQMLLMKRKDFSYCRKIVASFVSLVFSMQERNIRNRDYNCVKNAGVDGNGVLFLDVGSFALEERPLSFVDSEERARHFLKHFYRFARKNAPELIPVLDEEISMHLEKIRQRL